MRVIIKIGSNIIADEKGLNQRRIASIVAEIAKIHAQGHEVVVVSSGAVAAGMKRLGLKSRPSDIKHKQAAAAVGQSALMWIYEKYFAKHGVKVAQILLTRDAFYDRARYINAKNTILTLLDYQVIPIINENDSVSIDEIKFGDNDQLASLVAGLCDSQRLIILSDVDGLYTKDPKRFKDARLIETVEEITPELEAIAEITSSRYGTGGMYSKLMAAKRAMDYGITTNIINGNIRGLISKIINGQRCGTEFIPKGKRYSGKKGWIAFGVKAKGSIVIDDGAKDAIVKRGKSLLPTGIVSVEGKFSSGDAVYCLDRDGQRIAKGLTNYSSDEIEKIKGLRSSEIEKNLGYKYSDEVIHRDNLVLL